MIYEKVHILFEEKNCKTFHVYLPSYRRVIVVYYTCNTNIKKLEKIFICFGRYIFIFCFPKLVKIVIKLVLHIKYKLLLASSRLWSAGSFLLARSRCWFCTRIWCSRSWSVSSRVTVVDRADTSKNITTSVTDLISDEDPLTLE